MLKFCDDVYSFKMVCYEILIGCVPFHEIDSIIIFQKRIKKDGFMIVVTILILLHDLHAFTFVGSSNISCVF